MNGVDRYFNVIRNNNGRSIFGGGINSISKIYAPSIKRSTTYKQTTNSKTQNNKEGDTNE